MTLPVRGLIVVLLTILLIYGLYCFGLWMLRLLFATLAGL